MQVEGQTEEDLLFLLARDTDSFSKWEASQTLQRSLLLKLYNAAKQGSEVPASLHNLSRLSPDGLPNGCQTLQHSLLCRQAGLGGINFSSTSHLNKQTVFARRGSAPTSSNPPARRAGFRVPTSLSFPSHLSPVRRPNGCQTLQRSLLAHNNAVKAVLQLHHLL